MLQQIGSKTAYSCILQTTRHTYRMKAQTTDNQPHATALLPQTSQQSDMPMPSVSFFKALGDPIRLRIVHLLTRQDELCVCHFMQVFSLPQSSISRHLSTLRNAGLVVGRRDKLWVHYRLGIGDQSPYAGIIKQIAALNRIEPVLAEDLKRVKNISC